MSSDLEGKFGRNGQPMKGTKAGHGVRTRVLGAVDNSGNVILEALQPILVA